MAENNQSHSSDQPVQLKDPFVAGILAWLIPGLGHFYQGRNAKGALFAICVLGTFIYGLYLGGSNEVGWGRAVYYQFDEKEWRLPWLCQIGVGFPTFPLTLLQSKMKTEPLLNGFMAPPLPPSTDNPLNNGPPGARPKPTKMSSAWINRLLPHYFELATVYTMIAGLLNILAVYDACCGPVPAESGRKEGENPEGKRHRENGEEKA